MGLLMMLMTLFMMSAKAIKFYAETTDKAADAAGVFQLVEGYHTYSVYEDEG